MLRITTIDDGPMTTFRLEGKLVGEWVDELERCYVSVKTVDPQRKIEIDISDLDFIDKKGEVLLERLYLDGARPHGDNPFLRSLIDGILEHSKAGPRNQTLRD